MRYRHLLLGLATLSLGVCLAAKKKNPDDFTQTHEVAKDPPAVAVAETRRLVFHVSPLSGKGLLSQQTRDALKAILRINGGVPVVHLRAFVAGSGDIRRIPQIVSEVFGEKKLPLPSVSVLRAGGLPLENAQVVLESVSIAKRDSNSGLDMIAGEAFTDPDPMSPPANLLRKALDQLSGKVSGNALQVSCFVSTMNRPEELTAAIAAKFPSAAVNLVQPQRGPGRGMAVCEAVTPGSRISAERLAFTGTRVAFGDSEKDAALVFQRMDRDLTETGASPASIVFRHVYPLTGAVADMVARGHPQTAPSLVVPFEGLASIDAGFAVDSVAAVSK